MAASVYRLRFVVGSRRRVLAESTSTTRAGTGQSSQVVSGRGGVVRTIKSGSTSDPWKRTTERSSSVHCLVVAATDTALSSSVEYRERACPEDSSDAFEDCRHSIARHIIAAQRAHFRSTSRA